MSTTLKGRSLVRQSWTFEDTTDPGLSTPKDNDELRYIFAFTNGTGVDQADKMYRDRRTLTANTGTDLLDLAGGLVDAFGNTLTFSKINIMLVENKGLPAAGNDGTSSDTWTKAAGQDLLVGGAASNAWDVWLNETAGAEVRVRSGSMFLLTAPQDGYRVIAGTDDILQVLWDGSVASGGDIEYDIMLIGS